MSAFSRKSITLLSLCVGLPALGCGGDGDDGGTPPSTTTIAKASNSGDGQTGSVGQALNSPLQVVVTDGGAPAAGVTVTWSTTAASGSMTPTSTPTDANGIASTTWGLGTLAGPQSAQATLSGASGSPITFTATATAGPATTLAEAGGNNQTGQINTALALPVQAKVTDEFGNAVAGLDVAWAATGATVAAPIVPSNGSGISAATVTLGGTAGPITITATSNDLTGVALTGSPVTFSATATEQPPPSTDANVGVINNQFTPASLTISAGTTVVWTWAASAQNHNVAPAASEPARSGNPVDGPRTYQYKFNTPGTYVYFCEFHGSALGGMRGTITVQ